MRYITIILLLLAWGQCLSQTDYDEKCLEKLDEVRELTIYDNDVVLLVDSIDYGNLRYRYWNPNELYYEGDLVRYKYCPYRVLTDSSIGQRPDTARTTWALSGRLHPFLFLRDTARLDDLKKMMLEKHPYIRSYAFAALSYRKSDNMFSLILDNLKDTTKLEIAGCTFEEVYPADLMIGYEIDRLTNRQKKKLRELIKSNYRYLTRSLEYLDRK